MTRGAKCSGAMAAIVLALSAPPAKTAIFTSWSVGQEREIEPGVYARLTAQQSGWRIWRFEMKNDSFCKAIKSAKGRPHPVPLGVGSNFFGGTPFVSFQAFSPSQTYWELEGAESESTTEFRIPGERFWTDFDGQSLTDLDGKVIEVHVEGWEYPEIYVGHSDERALMDLVGTAWAVRATIDCTDKS